MKPTIQKLYAQAAGLKKSPYLVTDKHLRYADAIERINALSGLFKELGLHAGDRIAVLSDNDTEVSLLFLSCLFNGIVFSVLDEDIKTQRATSVLQRYAPQRLFIDSDKASQLQLDPAVFPALILQEMPSKGLLSRFIKKPASETDYFQRLEQVRKCEPTFEVVNDDQSALVLFTSGTTSHPKGVELSFKNLFTHLATLKKVYGFTDRSRSLNILPLSHADGLIQGPLLAFYAHATLYRPFVFKIQRIKELTEFPKTRKVTHMFATPTMLSLILMYTKAKKEVFAYKQFRTVISVAAMLEANLCNAFIQAFHAKVINVYGLTETVAGSLFTDPDNPSHAGTIGVPVDCETKIVSHDGTIAPHGEVGELMLKGPHIMKGYFADEAATQNVLNGGWLATGDLVQQRNNAYVVVGRKKNALVCGGFTVYPEEITEVLNTHDAVAESVTFGRNNEQWGEEVISAVVLKTGYSIETNELIEHCRKQLEAYKIPRLLHIVDALPKGRSGKVQLEALKELLAARTSGTCSLLDQVRQIASECFMVPVEEVTPDSSSENLKGWDSMGHLDFMMQIERTFSIKLKTSEILGIDTIDDAVNILKAKA